MASPDGAPSLAGVLLAAGASTRLPPPPKQLRQWNGEPLVRRAARAALAAGLRPLLVVTGHQAEEVELALAGLGVRPLRNADYRSGQASSVRRGVLALPESASGAMFLPCDQPFLDEATIRTIAASFCGSGDIVVPRHGATTGAPVVFGRALFAELAALSGDTGGRSLLARHPAAIRYADLPSDLPLLDIDSEEDLRQLASLDSSHPRAR